MNWVTIIWSMVVSASLTLAAINLLVWSRDRRSWAHFCFSLMVVGVIGLAVGEMGTMKAASPEEFGRAVLWAHFLYAIGIVGSLAFVHFYFGTGRLWLFCAAIGLRLLAVVMNFTTGMNLHISSIKSLQKVSLLGEQVTVLGDWVANPWVRLGIVASLVWLIYVVDASVRLWRAGSHDSRRRAVIVGGSLTLFIFIAVAQAGLVVAGVLRMPFIVSLPFLGVVLAMSYELSRDMLRAAQLGRDLRESEQRMTLAAEAANLGVWIRDLVRNEIWATARWRALFGFTKSESLDLEKFFARLHPDDREGVRRALTMATDGDGSYETEFRAVLPNGQTRWIASRGHVDFNGGGKPVQVRGVSIDITKHKLADLELLQQRTELAHLSRVTMLGELSGSLAHELNQPLTAILSNAQAAQRFMSSPDLDLDEVRDILADIVEQDNRAGAVIHRLRLLLKKGEVEQHPLDVNDVVQEVLKLIRSDLANQGVAMRTELAPGLPNVTGDRVQLQQVLLNLLMNACDAMNGNASADRQIIVGTALGNGADVRFSVSDSGSGLAPEGLEQVFEPFFTTKTQGLGLGLSVCRTIISAHAGRLWATNNPESGATFQFTLPVSQKNL